MRIFYRQSVIGADGVIGLGLEYTSKKLMRVPNSHRNLILFRNFLHQNAWVLCANAINS